MGSIQKAWTGSMGMEFKVSKVNLEQVHVQHWDKPWDIQSLQQRAQWKGRMGRAGCEDDFFNDQCLAPENVF